MSSAFQRFAPRLQEAIVARLGWASLRPVQEQAAHALLDGDNAVILAPTAGGKTEASFFPFLSQAVESEPGGLAYLYLAPIKALLNNQAERLGGYAEMVGLRRFLWHGDIAEAQRRTFLADPATFLMTTPESLEVMLLSSRVAHAKLFAGLRGVIIDEVHALAGSDRGAHLLSVLERIAVHSRRDVQRVGLSATVGNPNDILSWLQGTSNRAGQVIDPPQEPSPKDLRIQLCESTAALAHAASRRGKGAKSLFFCQSRALTETVAERMRGCGTEVFVHHSSVSTEERRAAEARFAHGSNACIVCTSTLELGIDVGDLDFVFQADAPATVSSFLQRLGRTGRRSDTRANTTFFCEAPESALQAIALIELARRRWVESVPVTGRCWPVLVHQLLALAFQDGAIHRDAAWDQLSKVFDFRDITREEFECVVDHMVREDYLWESAGEGKLSIGDQTERVFGRKNFMELYAVFSSPQLYRVQTRAGQEIGQLEQAFVDKLVEEMSSFLLGGRGWTVVTIRHSDRRVIVQPAPRGRKPSWGGFAPQLLGEELCVAMRDVLTSEEEIPYVDPAVRAALAEMRADLGETLQRPFAVRLEQTEAGSRILWWTCAGGRINHALRHGLLLIDSELKIVVDNLRVRIEAEKLTMGRLEEMVEKLSREDFWTDPQRQGPLAEQLPDYRLSKFQRALPQEFALEMVQEYLLDIPGARRLCSGVRSVQ